MKGDNDVRVFFLGAIGVMAGSAVVAMFVGATGPMQNGVPYWVQLLGALATPAIAFGGAWVAYSQLKINGAKLRLDLFSHRVAVYDAIRSAIAVALEVNPEFDRMGAIFKAERDAEFLFGPEVLAAIVETRKQVIEQRRLLHVIGSHIRNPTGGQEQHSANCAKEAEVLNWLFNQSAVLHRLMVPYMTFPK